MSREYSNDFVEQWKNNKVNFDNCVKKVNNYKTRPLDDENRKIQYKNELIAEYNKIVTWIADCIEEFNRDSQKILLEKIDECEVKLQKSLKILDFEVDLPVDKLHTIDVSAVKKLNVSSDEEFIEASNGNKDENLASVSNISEDKAEKQESQIVAEKSNIVENISGISSNFQNNITMAPPSPEAFLGMCGKQMPKHFAGDPLELKSFLISIKLLIVMAVSDENKKLLANFVISRLDGKASDCIDEECEDIEEIVKLLKENIKPEHSKVVAGRLMALKADRANLTDFAKRAEALAESFQRSLIFEGSAREKAIDDTVDKVIDLCKANTSSSIIKSVLASSKFADAKEVIAKYTIESRNAVADSQVLQFRSNFRNRGGFNRNFRGNFQQRNGGYNGGYNGYNGQRHRGNNRSGAWNNNNNSNYRGRSSFGNQGGPSRGNFRGGNERRNNVFYNTAENEQAPPSGAQCIRMDRAET